MKSKQVHSVKTVLAEIEILRRQYRKATRGFRKELYAILQRAQCIISGLLRHEELARQLIVKARKSAPKRLSGVTGLSQAVLMMMGMHSRQVAWKRARALDFLRKQGFPDDRIARTLKKCGGIEKVVREAAALDGRRPEHRNSSGTEHSTGSDRRTLTNNVETIVPIRMKLADLDQTRESAVGSLVTLVARRVGQLPDLNVIKVTVEDADSQRSENEDDD